MPPIMKDDEARAKAAQDNPHLVETKRKLLHDQFGDTVGDLASGNTAVKYNRTYVTLVTASGLKQLKDKNALTEDAYNALMKALPLRSTTGRYVVVLEGAGTDTAKAVRAFRATEEGRVASGKAVKVGSGEISHNSSGFQYKIDDTLKLDGDPIHAVPQPVENFHINAFSKDNYAINGRSAKDLDGILDQFSAAPTQMTDALALTPGYTPPGNTALMESSSKKLG